MAYKVISGREVCGKKQGEILTLKEIEDAGANSDALIASGHIQASQPTIKPALSEGAKKLWSEHGQADNEAIAKYIQGNLEILISKNKPISGAPGRKDMPQTDYGDKNMTKTLDFIKNGIVNFKNPKSTDIKDNNIKEIKRLQKLAGIK